MSEILDVAIAGDEEPVATLDRPHIQALLDDPDPVLQLHGQAAVTRRVYERLAPALVLQSPETYMFLTGQRGWGPEKYERWLASALTTELLGPGRRP